MARAGAGRCPPRRREIMLITKDNEILDADTGKLVAEANSNERATDIAEAQNNFDRLKSQNAELLAAVRLARQVLANIIDQPSPTVTHLDRVIAAAETK
jgi:hypothetical protein